MKRQRFLGAVLLVCAGVAGISLFDGSRREAIGEGPCVDGDLNGDGLLDISDAVHLLSHLFLGGPAPAACDPPAAPASTVIIVRHAERDNIGADPGLNDAGKARAQHLAQVLARARIDFLIASDLRRTQETLQPTADLKGLAIEKIADATEVVARVKALPAGSLAVVAHHSFTILPILQGLGISDTASINVAGDNYDNFLEVLRPAGQDPQLIHLTY